MQFVPIRKEIKSAYTANKTIREELNISNRPLILGNKKNFEDNFILNRHQNEFYDLQIDKGLSVFSIVFQPQGLMTFFNFPLNELYNQSVPLKYLNRKLEQEILPQLINVQSFEQRVQIVEGYFSVMLKEEHNRFSL